MYIIVVGAGNIGTPLIGITTESGNEVIVVERDEAKTEAAAVTFDCLVLNDDATVKQTLDEADADRANIVVTTTDKDAANIMVCLLARKLDILDIVPVAHNPEHMSLCRQIGINTMENPQRFTAGYLYRTVRHSSIVNYMHIDEHAKVFEVRVDEDVPTTRMAIQGATQENLLDGDTLIVAVERGSDDNPVMPHGNTTVGAGDLLTVYSAKGATPEMTDVFGHYKNH